ncbi:MAG: murein hydrolase activator EnvC family protein [Chthonomonadales bacterium]
MRNNWVAGFLVAAVLSALGCAAAAAPHHSKTGKSPKELRRQLHAVRARIHAQRLEVRRTRAKEHHVVGEIDRIEARILTTEQRLRAVKSRLAAIARRRKVLIARMDFTQKRLDGRRRVLARRLRENYELGSTSYVQALLSSRSMHDYLSRSYYVERIVESDVKLMAGIREDQAQLLADQRELDARDAEQRVLKAELERSYFQYREDVLAKRRTLEQIQEDREAKEAALDELEEASNEIAARLRALEQTPGGRARLLRAWTGHFIRPAWGPITSGFGMRYHPILHRTRMHTGVDIGAGYGEPIRAAAAGEVVMAGYMRGYGYVVIIDHGGGVSTLYGHCSELLVSEGQSVRQGQVIARVGSTGLATGPHLHFEVRRNGVPVNPF